MGAGKHAVAGDAFGPVRGNGAGDRVLADGDDLRNQIKASSFDHGITNSLIFLSWRGQICILNWGSPRKTEMTRFPSGRAAFSTESLDAPCGCWKLTSESVVSPAGR